MRGKGGHRVEKGIWSNHVTYVKEIVVMKPRTMLREYKLIKISNKQKVSIALANSLDILSIPLKYVSISGHFLESLMCWGLTTTSYVTYTRALDQS